MTTDQRVRFNKAVGDLFAVIKAYERLMSTALTDFDRGRNPINALRDGLFIAAARAICQTAWNNLFQDTPVPNELDTAALDQLSGVFEGRVGLTAPAAGVNPFVMASCMLDVAESMTKSARLTAYPGKNVGAVAQPAAAVEPLVPRH